MFTYHIDFFCDPDTHLDHYREHATCYKDAIEGVEDAFAAGATWAVISYNVNGFDHLEIIKKA